MLKITSTLALLLVMGVNTHAQNIDEDNIYYRALKEYARWVERFEPETDTVYFEEVKGITNYFPKEINGIKVELITGRNQTQIYTAHGGRLTHRKMTPALVIENRIEIGLIPYEGQYSAQSGIRLGLRNWHNIIFEFNTQSGKFEYRRIDNN